MVEIKCLGNLWGGRCVARQNPSESRGPKWVNEEWGGGKGFGIAYVTGNPATLFGLLNQFAQHSQIGVDRA